MTLYRQAGVRRRAGRISLPCPFQYQGSKRSLAASILQYVPAGVERLIEPFAGSAAISIAAAAGGMARHYHINDLNRPLIDLLQRSVECPDEIAASYEHVWTEQHGRPSDHYNEVRAAFNARHDPVLLLYLLARCVKGSVRYNSEGHFNQSPDTRRSGTAPLRMRANIRAVSELLKDRATFTAVDYRETLAQAVASDLVYLDPPYQGVSGGRDRRYLSGICQVEFVAALENLNARTIAYIVSYDGRRGERTFGEPLPERLGLARVSLKAGRSSQATLLGRNEATCESLYLSPALAERLAEL